MSAILPDKYLPLEDTYLGLGYEVLKYLKAEPLDVVRLWKKCAKKPSFGTYDRFITTLGVLYRVGLIDLDENDLLRRMK